MQLKCQLRSDILCDCNPGLHNQLLLLITGHLKVAGTCSQNVCRTETYMRHSQWTSKFKVAVTLLISFCTLFLILCLKPESPFFILISLNQHLQIKKTWSHRLRGQKSWSTVSCHLPDKIGQCKLSVIAAIIDFLLLQILALGFTGQARTFSEFQKMWKTVARPSSKAITSYVFSCLWPPFKKQHKWMVKLPERCSNKGLEPFKMGPQISIPKIGKTKPKKKWIQGSNTSSCECIIFWFVGAWTPGNPPYRFYWMPWLKLNSFLFN